MFNNCLYHFFLRKSCIYLEGVQFNINKLPISKHRWYIKWINKGALNQPIDGYQKNV